MKMKSSHRKYKTLTLIILLIAYLCSFPGLGNAAVVCFGDDGHVSIKSIATNLRVQHATSTEHSFEIEKESHCEDKCRSCVDYPLSYTTTHQNILQNKYAFKLLKNTLHQSAADFLHLATPIGNRPPSVINVSADNTITSLRTIILLI